MSGEWFPITSAEQLVRHLLRWDTSADEIERRLKDNVLGRLPASLEEWKTIRRLIKHRREWERVDAERELGESDEAMAHRLEQPLRTLQRWRHGT